VQQCSSHQAFNVLQLLTCRRYPVLLAHFLQAKATSQREPSTRHASQEQQQQHQRRRRSSQASIGSAAAAAAANPPQLAGTSGKGKRRRSSSQVAVDMAGPVLPAVSNQHSKQTMFGACTSMPACRCLACTFLASGRFCLAQLLRMYKSVFWDRCTILPT
jgi:hypothetical protein